MSAPQMTVGGRYNWRNQPERLVYLGAAHYPGDRRHWHQFALVEKPGKCWCEVLDSDLSSFEESTPATNPIPSQGTKEHP